jgi:hypothetical protein
MDLTLLGWGFALFEAIYQIQSFFFSCYKHKLLLVSSSQQSYNLFCKPDSDP